MNIGEKWTNLPWIVTILLMLATVNDINYIGAILVFLPGVAEIHTLLDKLAASYQFRGEASEWLLPLHSNIASSEQKYVFQRPPDGIRK
nr:DExH-box ATP-dependent RNA helicase DExH7, chloroplastic isoform X1 [Tanacetum cinerariifolium]